MPTWFREQLTCSYSTTKVFSGLPKPLEQTLKQLYGAKKPQTIKKARRVLKGTFLVTEVGQAVGLASRAPLMVVGGGKDPEFWDVVRLRGQGSEGFPLLGIFLTPYLFFCR